MGDSGLMRWWLRFDAPTRTWYALPWWREWSFDRKFKEGTLMFGPRGSKGFETLSEAADYAHDLHHCYQDGWLP